MPTLGTKPAGRGLALGPFIPGRSLPVGTETMFMRGGGMFCGMPPVAAVVLPPPQLAPQPPPLLPQPPLPQPPPAELPQPEPPHDAGPADFAVPTLPLPLLLPQPPLPQPPPLLPQPPLPHPLLAELVLAEPPQPWPPHMVGPDCDAAVMALLLDEQQPPASAPAPQCPQPPAPPTYSIPATASPYTGSTAGPSRLFTSAPQDGLPSMDGAASSVACKTANTAATSAKGVMDMLDGRIKEASNKRIKAVLGSQLGSVFLVMLIISFIKDYA